MNWKFSKVVSQSTVVNIMAGEFSKIVIPSANFFHES